MPSSEALYISSRSSFVNSIPMYSLSDPWALRSESESESIRTYKVLAEEAEYLGMMGFRVLPLTPGGKVPLLAGGLRAASSNISDIQEWWKRWPSANIGLLLDDLLVIDDDNPKHGKTTEQTDGLDAPCVVTPSGGTHHYFERPKGFHRRLGIDGIDFLTGQGYVLVPPSIVGGVAYRWASGDARSLVGLLEPPKETLAMLMGGHGTGDALDLSAVMIGNRNTTLYGLGSRLLAFGYPERIVEMILSYATSIMPGKFETAEVLKIMHSLQGYSTRASASLWTSPTDRLNEKEFDHKVAQLCGVLRGADATEPLLMACIYGLAASIELLFQPTQAWVMERAGRACEFRPQMCHFLRRNGAEDVMWGGFTNE